MWYYVGHGTLYWSYPGNSAKCDTMASNSTLLLPWFSDFHVCFWVACLSIPSVPTLCLKDPQMGNDIFHPECLLTVGMVRWSKLSGCWQLKDKKNSLLIINNYLLERTGVAIIYPKYLQREIVTLLSRYVGVYYYTDCIQFSSSHQRTRDRDRDSRQHLRVYEQRQTCRNTESITSVAAPKGSVDLNCNSTNNWLPTDYFSKFTNFYIF